MEKRLKKTFMYFQRIFVKYGRFIIFESLRKRILTKLLKVPGPLPDSITFKVAETRKEFEGAFSLIYQNYLRLGFVKPNKAEICLKFYHALPESSVLIAKKGEKVIGTMSLIRDNEFGLALEQVFPLSGSNTKNKRMVEICSFAVDLEYRRTSGSSLAFYMLKFMYEYCANYLNISYIFIAIYPHHFDFYNFIFGFNKWNKEVRDYMGAPAINCALDIKKAPTILAKKMRDFFLDQKIKNFQFPQRPYNKITDNNMSPEDMDYFFNKKSSVFQSLEDNKLVSFYLKYRKSFVKELLPSPKNMSRFVERNQRFEVDCDVKIGCLNYNTPLYHASAKNISRSGIKLVGKDIEPLTGQMLLHVKIGNGTVAKVKANVIHQNENEQICILKISDSCQKWQEYINYLERDRNKTNYEVNREAI